MLETISTECKSEMANIERFSSIKNVTVEALTFNDEVLCEELDRLCPVLSSALRGATDSVNYSDEVGSRLLCYSALVKSRFPKRSTVVAHRNDQLLIASGAKRKAFQWFNKMGFSNSYSTALRKNNQLALDRDAGAIQWKENVERIFERQNKLPTEIRTEVEGQSEEKAVEYEVNFGEATPAIFAISFSRLLEMRNITFKQTIIMTNLVRLRYRDGCEKYLGTRLYYDKYF